MRATLIVFVTACLPAFCQEKEKPFVQPADTFLQGLAQRNHPPVALPEGITLSAPAPAMCSIPLLNVKPPGQPVAMPKLIPSNSGSGDRMQVVAPAPACAANFGHIGAPAPALPPPPGPAPTAPPPPAAPPAKP